MNGSKSLLLKVKAGGIISVWDMYLLRYRHYWEDKMKPTFCYGLSLQIALRIIRIFVKLLAITNN